MKKILGISLVAVLAATPLMAEAARDVTALNAATPTTSTTVASTSYVQGAYKAAADQIDNLITDTNVAENGNYIDANTSVAHNLGELDTAVKANTDAIGSATYNGDSLSEAVATLQTSIGDGANALGGRVTTLENTMGNTAITNDLTATTVTDAINELSSEKVDQAGNFTDQQNNSALIYGKTVVNAIKDTASAVDANTAAIGDANSGLTKAIADEKSRAETAESGLANRIGTLEQHDNALAGTYATKTGVDNTIKAVTLTTTGEQGLDTTNAAVAIATDWNNAAAVSSTSFLTSATLTGQTTVEINDESVSYTTANTTPGSQEQQGD